MIEHDIDELEHRLERIRVQPPAGLRIRVLGAMSHELREQHRWNRWKRMASVAALFLLWCHVSWSVALDSRPDSLPLTASEFEQDTVELRNLLPDLPEAEVRRMILIMSAGQLGGIR